jgi:Kef-type K+ transport system membrane component KefB
MNLANSANPVIARILMDLGLLRTRIGTVIMCATVIDDLVNWSLFAIILGAISPSGATSIARPAIDAVAVMAFMAAVVGMGRWLGPHALGWTRKLLKRPSGLVALTAVLVLLVAGAAEALGLHAFLGAFLAGVALGGRHEHQIAAREAMGQFVMSFSIGMSTNFIRHFDPPLVAVVFAAACVSKVGSVLIGVKAAGLPLDREAWAIGFGLNARGATGVILAGIGLANGVIDERLFVAIVAMAMATSLMSGPVMSRLLSHHRTAGVPRLAAVTDQAT